MTSGVLQHTGVGIFGATLSWHFGQGKTACACLPPTLTSLYFVTSRAGACRESCLTRTVAFYNCIGAFSREGIMEQTPARVF